MVQNELAALTMVEMKKRDLKVITIIISIIITITILMYVVVFMRIITVLMNKIELDYPSES